jgi:uncharacterized protein YcbK (DUF882 family)
MLRLSLTLLVIMASARTAGAEPAAPAVAASDGRRAKAASAKTSDKRSAKSRTKHNGRMVGWPVSDKALRAEPAPQPTGKLRVYSLNYKDEIDVNIYNPDGSFDVNALAEVNHVFKCRRSGLEHEIDTRLVTILSQIYEHFGEKRVELLSGYRFQRRTTSNHFHGTAADIRIAGVDPRKIRSFAESLDAGGMGVGWYPRVGFVHVDVRPPPSYRWIDYSRSNPDARDRKLPRGFKRVAPES